MKNSDLPINFLTINLKTINKREGKTIMANRSNTEIKVCGTEEEQQLVYKFIRKEKYPFTFDEVRVLSMPESFCYLTEPTAEMEQFVNWIRKTEEKLSDLNFDGMNIYASKNISEYMLAKNIVRHPFIFTRDQWLDIRAMLRNIEQYGFTEKRDWIYQQYGTRMISDFNVCRTSENITISCQSMWGGAYFLGDILSTKFPEQQFFMRVDSEGGDYYEYIILNGSATLVNSFPIWGDETEESDQQKALIKKSLQENTVETIIRKVDNASPQT